MAKLLVTFDEVAGADDYTVFYRIKYSADQYASVTGASSPIEVDGLACGTEYEGRIQTNCASGHSTQIGFTTNSVLCSGAYDLTLVNCVDPQDTFTARVNRFYSVGQVVKEISSGNYYTVTDITLDPNGLSGQGDRYIEVDECPV